MKKRCMIIAFILITLVIHIVYINNKNVRKTNSKIDIEKILKNEDYNYLPEEAKEIVRTVYEESGEIIKTEKNKEAGEFYLNPLYTEYLSLSIEERNKVDYIPKMYISEYQFENIYFDNEIPTKYDLTNVGGKNFLSEQKNQGQLGNCWAYSTIEQTESLLMIKNNQSRNQFRDRFSARQIDYLTSTDGITDYESEYGARVLGEGGNFMFSSNALATGLSYVSQDEFSKNLTSEYSMNSLEMNKVFNFKNSLYELTNSFDMSEYPSDGTENDKKEYLEMEILDGTINVFKIDVEGGEEQRTISFDESLVNSIVEEFYDRAV